MNQLRPTSPTALTPSSAVRPMPEMSTVNLSARQRMLSQRMVLQAVLAAQGREGMLDAARQSLKLFQDSHKTLLATVTLMDGASAQRLKEVYDGPRGVAHQIDAFIRLVTLTLDAIEQRPDHPSRTLAQLEQSVDPVLAALNSATTAFDSLSKSQSDVLIRELSTIVADIQTVAREAKVVSFNAQVLAARAGPHGREFSVVAHVLTDITQEIDGLSRKAVDLAERNRRAA